MRLRSFLAVATLGAIASAHANLLTNGGFESSVVSASTLAANSGYQRFGAGDADITGWTIGANSVDIVSNPGSWASGVHDGAYAIDLNGTPGPGSLSQSFNTTTSKLFVSFWAMSNEGGQAVSVKLNGGSVALLPTGTPPPGGINGSYYQYTYYVANANVGSNTLEFDIAPGSYGNTYLDSVSVTAVPGPAGALVFGLGFLRRRRK